MRDVVFAGPDRDDIAALVFPDVEACRKLAPALRRATRRRPLLDDVRVRAKFAELLQALAALKPRLLDPRRARIADGGAAVDG